jgi:hypothetical protein
METKQDADQNAWRKSRPFIMFLLLAIAWQSFS